MSEQGAGFSSVVWKKKKKTETAKEEDTTHQDEATTNMTGTLTAETGTTITQTSEINFVPVEHDKWTVSGIGEAKLSVAGKGYVNLHATVNRKTLNGTMRGVLFYVPGLGINLYAIKTAMSVGCRFPASKTEI
jgi:hypothetical protein